MIHPAWFTSDMTTRIDRLSCLGARWRDWLHNVHNGFWFLSASISDRLKGAKKHLSGFLLHEEKKPIKHPLLCHTGSSMIANFESLISCCVKMNINTLHVMISEYYSESFLSGQWKTLAWSHLQSFLWNFRPILRRRIRKKKIGI